uniref:Uncharacterized protein n=1 Tax=Timema cristinae TaxID=61476 RepID=A0A7R9DCF0_TIMCR|nr:unnamed protein product [Timema cristinae]
MEIGPWRADAGICRRKSTAEWVERGVRGEVAGIVDNIPSLVIITHKCGARELQGAKHQKRGSQGAKHQKRGLQGAKQQIGNGCLECERLSCALQDVAFQGNGCLECERLSCALQDVAFQGNGCLECERLSCALQDVAFQGNGCLECERLSCALQDVAFLIGKRGMGERGGGLSSSNLCKRRDAERRESWRTTLIQRRKEQRYIPWNLKGSSLTVTYYTMALSYKLHHSGITKELYKLPLPLYERCPGEHITFSSGQPYTFPQRWGSNRLRRHSRNRLNWQMTSGVGVWRFICGNREREREANRDEWRVFLWERKQTPNCPLGPE